MSPVLDTSGKELRFVWSVKPFDIPFTALQSFHGILTPNDSQEIRCFEMKSSLRCIEDLALRGPPFDRSVMRDLPSTWKF